MKTQLFALACACLLATSGAHAETRPPVVATGMATDSFTLTVQIEGVRSNKGTLMVQLLRADQLNAEGVPVEGKMVAAITGTATVTFTRLQAGVYAVKLFHDEDGNGVLKTNAFGIPKEGIGFSNRARAKFGPPKFDAMKVLVQTDTSTTATIAY